MFEMHPKELFEKYSTELEATDGTAIAALWNSQYDDYSAALNYAVVREIQPKVIVEFGSYSGRCTYDILRALHKNDRQFLFKSYEKDDEHRTNAQERLDKEFGYQAIILGGDITSATDIPIDIEYLFVDNSHDGPTTDWLFNVLLPRCIPGAIVQIHDIPLKGDFSLKKEDGVFQETRDILKRKSEGTLPLRKLYMASEDTSWESSWWEYQPL